MIARVQGEFVAMLNRVFDSSASQARQAAMKLEPFLAVEGRTYPSWYRELSNRTFHAQPGNKATPEWLQEVLGFSPSPGVKSDMASEVSYAVCGEIESLVRRQVRFSEKSVAYSDHTALVSDFNTSLTMVADFTDDFRRMLDDLCALNMEFHYTGEPDKRAHDDYLSKRSNQLSSIANANLLRPNPYVNANIETLPLEDAENALRQRLNQAIHAFAVQACKTLDRLCDQSVAGVIAWSTSTACNAFYTKNCITQSPMAPEVSVGDPVTVTVDGRPMSRQYTTTKTKGVHDLEFMFCPSYLSKADKHRCDDYRGTIPADIKQFLERLPKWLLELVRIVDGSRQSACIIKMPIVAESYEYTEVIPHDLPLSNPAYCPVVTLGHYVLTGWGAEENALEESRQSGWNMLVVAVMLLLIACLLLILGHPNYPVCIYGAAIAWGLSLTSYVRGIYDRAVSKERPTTVWRLASAGLQWFGVSFGMLTLTTGILRGSLILEFLGLGCLAFVSMFVFWRQLVPSKP